MIGVDRKGNAEELKAEGANIVVGAGVDSISFCRQPRSGRPFFGRLPFGASRTISAMKAGVSSGIGTARSTRPHSSASRAGPQSAICGAKEAATPVGPGGKKGATGLGS